jgi:hypothetical protein
LAKVKTDIFRGREAPKNCNSAWAARTSGLSNGRGFEHARLQSSPAEEEPGALRKRCWLKPNDEHARILKTTVEVIHRELMKAGASARETLAHACSRIEQRGDPVEAAVDELAFLRA